MRFISWLLSKLSPAPITVAEHKRQFMPPKKESR